VPPRRTVWIPAKAPHRIALSGQVSMRTLDLRAGMAKTLPRSCCVVNVSRLMQELMLHAYQHPRITRRSKRHAHPIDLILDQLETVRAIPLQLSTPSDQRAMRVARILEYQPADARSMVALCRRAGASKRTIERIFARETSLPLGKWRQQLPLLRSLQLLGGRGVDHHLGTGGGYSTPIAFIAMFRKALGTTPRQCLKKQPPATRNRGSRS
jgi:AraC-like DNA-binding protein